MSVFFGRNAKSVALALAFLITGIPARCEDGNQTQGWKFEQRSSSDGNMTVIVGESGVKLLQGDLICVCAAPNWQAVIANAKLKIGMSMSLRDWPAAGFHLAAENIVTSGVTEKKDRWKGMPSIVITRTITMSDSPHNMAEMGYRTGTERATGYSSEQLILSDWLNLKPQVVSFLGGVYRERDLKHFLLRRVNVYPSGKTDISIDTLLCSRVKISGNEFAVPFKFRTTKDRDQITLDPQKRKSIAGVVEDLFGAEPPTKAKAKSK